MLFILSSATNTIFFNLDFKHYYLLGTNERTNPQNMPPYFENILYVKKHDKSSEEDHLVGKGLSQNLSYDLYIHFSVNFI